VAVAMSGKNDSYETRVTEVKVKLNHVGWDNLTEDERMVLHTGEGFRRLGRRIDDLFGPIRMLTVGVWFAVAALAGNAVVQIFF